jgi:hypothetical protein
MPQNSKPQKSKVMMTMASLQLATGTTKLWCAKSSSRGAIIIIIPIGE